MEVNLLDRMLSDYLEKLTPVTVVLQNKTRLSGRIKAFDSYIIVLDNPKNEIVYRHSISSLAPRAETKQRSVQSPASLKSAAPRSALPSVRTSPNPAPAPTGTSINSGMKDGLLKWMQEQKAARRA